MLHENSFLGKLSREVIGKDIDFNFELFGHSILDILVDLSILMQEREYIWNV